MGLLDVMVGGVTGAAVAAKGYIDDDIIAERNKAKQAAIHGQRMTERKYTSDQSKDLYATQLDDARQVTSEEREYQAGAGKEQKLSMYREKKQIDQDFAPSGLTESDMMTAYLADMTARRTNALEPLRYADFKKQFSAEPAPTMFINPRTGQIITAEELAKIRSEAPSQDSGQDSGQGDAAPSPQAASPQAASAKEPSAKGGPDVATVPAEKKAGFLEQAEGRVVPSLEGATAFDTEANKEVRAKEVTAVQRSLKSDARKKKLAAAKKQTEARKAPATARRKAVNKLNLLRSEYRKEALDYASNPAGRAEMIRKLRAIGNDLVGVERTEALKMLANLESYKE